MRKFVAFISTLAFFFSLVALVPVFAQPLCPPGNFANLCNLKPQNFGSMIGVVVQIILIIAILSSLFFLIWGGIRYISSGGDKGKTDSARGTITAAIIGLIISLLAFFILNFLLVFFTGQGISNMSIPKLV